MTIQQVNQFLSEQFYSNGWELSHNDSISSVYTFNGMNIKLKCFVLLNEDGTSKVSHILNNELALNRSFNGKPNGVWDIMQTMDLFQMKGVINKCHKVSSNYEPEWYTKRDRKCLMCGGKPKADVDYCDSCIREIAKNILK